MSWGSKNAGRSGSTMQGFRDLGLAYQSLDGFGTWDSARAHQTGQGMGGSCET